MALNSSMASDLKADLSPSKTPGTLLIPVPQDLGESPPHACVIDGGPVSFYLSCNFFIFLLSSTFT